MEMEIDELCMRLKTHILYDSEKPYQELIANKNLKFSQISIDFINETRKRYDGYLKHIDLNLYADAGDRIIILLYDFLRTDPNNLKLLACKCKAIDRLLIELYEWEYSTDIY
jgi:hypothetical protein